MSYYASWTAGTTDSVDNPTLWVIYRFLYSLCYRPFLYSDLDPFASTLVSHYL